MTYRTSSPFVLAALSVALVHCNSQTRSAQTPSAANQGTTTVTATREGPEEPQMTPASGYTTPSEQAAPSASAAPETRALSDAQIAAIIDAANTAEIDQAKIAQQKCRDPRVKKFAAMMIADHGQAKRKQADWMKRTATIPSDSSQFKQLTLDASDTLSKLREVDKSDCDTTYMDAMVNAHQMVLDLLHDVLITNAQDPDLKKMLQDDVEPTVASHLERARELREALASKSSGSTTDTKRDRSPSGSSSNKSQTPDQSPPAGSEQPY